MTNNKNQIPYLAICNSHTQSNNTATLALQISHDIRSPLAALDTIINLERNILPENLELLRSIISRLREMADNVLEEYAGITVSPKPTNIQKVVELIINEKKQEYSANSKINFVYFKTIFLEDLTLNLNQASIKTALSNIINNAAESLDPINGGTITISIRKSSFDNSIEVTIEDDGKGMPIASIYNYGVLGYSKGQKTNKNAGYGSYQAKKAIEENGGRIIINSKINQGTKIRIIFNN